MNDALPRFTLAGCRTAIDIALWRHGVAGALAAACGLAALALHLFVNIPARDQLANLQQRVTQQARAAAAAPPAMPGPGSPTAESPLWQTLQSAPGVPEALQGMHEIAGAEQIAMPRAEYRQQQAAASAATATATSLVRTEVTQPLRATYPQLRRYLEAVLREFPSASLDQLSVRRENAAQPELEARLRWSLWRVAPGTSQRTLPPEVPALTERRWLMPKAGQAALPPALFAARAWVQTPSASPAIAATAPEAPPLPFSYLGKQLDEGRWVVFVARGPETLVLREGQTVDGLWRVDHTAPPTLRLTYLPLDQAFTLPIGDQR